LRGTQLSPTEINDFRYSGENKLRRAWRNERKALQEEKTLIFRHIGDLFTSFEEEKISL
jgi:hypothetical protein